MRYAAGTASAARIFVFAPHRQLARGSDRWALVAIKIVGEALGMHCVPADSITRLPMAEWQASRLIPDSSGLRIQFYISPHPHRSCLIFHFEYTTSGFF